jgi:hypothetical protein
MGKDDRASTFIVCLSAIVGLLAVLYGFYVMSLGAVDWAIFLIVIGFVILLFLATVYLGPRN